MTASGSSHRNSFVTRLKRSRYSLLLPGILSIIGCILLGGFGPIRLQCQRMNLQQSQGNIHRSAVFGLVERSNIEIAQVQRAELDIPQQVRLEASNGSSVSKELRNLYGVLIVGEQTALLDGYTPNQTWYEQEIIAPVKPVAAQRQARASGFKIS